MKKPRKSGAPIVIASVASAFVAGVAIGLNCPFTAAAAGFVSGFLGAFWIVIWALREDKRDWRRPGLVA